MTISRRCFLRFAPASIGAIDRRTIVSQQQTEKFDRAMLTPAGEVQRDMTLPAKATIAGKLLGFDGGSQPTAISQNDESANSVTPTDRTSSRTLAVQASLAQGMIDVTDPDYGAVGDYDPVALTGTNDQAAFTAAIAASASNLLFFPMALTTCH